jgi:Fe-Mn family superoxide dismutase
MAIALPTLPYSYDALEPVISAATLNVHYAAHHSGYVQKLNTLIRGTDLDTLELEEIVKRSFQKAATSPSAWAIFNNAAQAWNHAFYWKSLRPAKRGASAPQPELAARIASDFGGRQEFSAAFRAAALSVFGSGWVWLVLEDRALKIKGTSNADTPLVHGQTPLLVLDVWEHAYYLDYTSKRDAHVAAVVDQLLNWEFAESQLLKEAALTP